MKYRDRLANPNHQRIQPLKISPVSRRDTAGVEILNRKVAAILPGANAEKTGADPNTADKVEERLR